MQIICDTHVHCYDFERLPDLLNAAFQNFQNQDKADANVLFFTDGKRDRTWTRLRPLAELGSTIGDWQLTYSAQTGLIQASSQARQLYLAPARQVNSAARLEYLLLGCDVDVDDGQDDAALIAQYASSFAVICPWGAGKWLGQRGKLLTRLLDQYAGQLFLGDNGGRPTLWGWVPQFRHASTRRLNGSDPLPFHSELSRIGGYGITFQLNTETLTLTTLLDEIRRNKHSNYGNNLGIIAFIVAQFKMRRA